ncbi:hypothetical protein DMENIID0001_027590 [Sergentomyia squamirostris]
MVGYHQPSDDDMNRIFKENYEKFVNSKENTDSSKTDKDSTNYEHQSNSNQQLNNFAYVPPQPQLDFGQKYSQLPELSQYMNEDQKHYPKATFDIHPTLYNLHQQFPQYALPPGAEQKIYSKQIDHSVSKMAEPEEDEVYHQPNINDYYEKQTFSPYFSPPVVPSVDFGPIGQNYYTYSNP